MFTTENRLWRPISNGLGWLVGATYTHNRTTLGRDLGTEDEMRPTTGVSNRIDEVTGFAEASAQSGRVTVTSGLRWTHDRLSGAAKDVSPIVATKLLALGTTAARSEGELLPSGSVSVQLPGRTVAFVRYQEGMRAGGLAVEGEQVRRFKGDRVRSAETGLRFGGGAISLVSGALSASYTRWTNIQADFIDATGLPSTSNVGDGRIYSLNGSVRLLPARGLSFELSSTFNGSRITDPSADFVQALINAAVRYSPSGLPPSGSEPLGRIPNIARLSLRTAATYDVQLGGGRSLRLEGWTKYVGRSRLGVGPVLGGEQGQYADTGVSARVSTGNVGVSISVTNLFDVVGNRFALGTPFARELAQLTPLRPRTVRIGVAKDF
jgi:iron complex outermembrane recepter protein